MADPYANPYLMPQPAPDWRQVLSNALIGVGGGISSADASGRGWAAGIGPGLMYANQMTGQQNQNAWQRQMQGLQYQSLLDQRRAQEEARREKLDMAKAAAAREAALGDSIGTLLGMNVQPNPVRMGEGAYGDVVAAGESGGKYDISNLRGSGAYGKYQFMPTTWADVATKNPNLGLPFNMRQSTPQQQEAAFSAFTRGNAAELQKAGIQPTPENLYYAHRFGVDGAKRFVAADPNTPIPQLFPDWVRQNPDLNTTVGQFRQTQQGRFAQVGGRVVPQGDAIAGQGDAPITQQSAIASLPAEVRGAIGIVAQSDPKKAATMLVDAIQNQEKEGAWVPLDAKNKAMFPNLDPTKEYLRNRRTGEIKPIGGAQTVVNVDQKGQTEFGKQMGKMDAERFGEIIKSEGTLNDMASKIGFALDQLKQTYTGPAGETANAFFGVLGTLGVEGAKDKKNAADAAMAVISQMKPYMRAAGSGASSDKDMDMFARALPSLINMPGGNERIGAYFQRLADRATAIRQLAQEHSEGGKVPLTGTGFDDAVKKLGPLFSEEERKEMMEAGKAKAAPKTDRPPISSFGREVPPAASMPPAQRPPLSSFGRGG